MSLRRLLTLLTALAALVLAPSTATAQRGDADMAALAAYRLSEAKLDQYVRASRAAYAAMRDPAVRAQLAAWEAEEEADERDDDGASIAELVARLDRLPTVKKAIASAGLAPRDYVVLQLSLLQASIALAVLEMPGSDGKLPEGTPRANVDFARKHRATLERIGAELRALGESDDEDPDADEDPPAGR